MDFTNSLRWISSSQEFSLRWIFCDASRAVVNVYKSIANLNASLINHMTSSRAKLFIQIQVTTQVYSHIDITPKKVGSCKYTFELFLIMAAQLLYVCNARALQRERVFRDRLNPLDTYSDRRMHKYYRFTRRGIMQVIDILQPHLQNQTQRSHAIDPRVQIFVALRYYATGDFYSSTGGLLLNPSNQ